MARLSPKRSRPRTVTVDPFAVHEALDRASLAAAIVDEYLAQHPFVRSKPKLRKQADEIVERLSDLYQAIGQFS